MRAFLFACLIACMAPALAAQNRLPAEQAAWHDAMAKIPLPKRGCFAAAYPKREWKEVACVAPPNKSYGPHVGGGVDFAAEVAGHITSATGSFDSVSGVTDEFGFGNTPNTYSLQLNSGYFSSPAACAGASVPANCQGWEQFIYTNTGGVLIEYWLLHYGPSCPPGWIPSPPSCYRNSMAMPTPVQPLANLGQLMLTGSADAASNTDTVTLFTGANMYVATGDDDLVNLPPGWNTAEYNIFGDGGGTQAVFNAGATIRVRTTVHSGTMAPPMCQLEGFSSESNNLMLIGAPVVPVAPAPAIVFDETDIPGALPGCAMASGVGDTHLTTFSGLLYDFQASGDFVLADDGAHFTVQTRQASGAPMWPNAAVNKAVAARIDGTRVAICLEPTRLEIDGKPRALADGQSLALANGVRLWRDGEVYVVTGKRGDSVRAALNPGWINVSVGLGRWPRPGLRGLLVNPGGDVDRLMARDGTVLTEPVSFDDLYHRYGDSWRVPAKERLLCDDRKIERGIPSVPFYAADLDPRVRERAQTVCVRAGVKAPALLDACTLDVAVLGNARAAEVYVGMAAPVAVGVPGSHIGPPRGDPPRP